MMNSFDQFKQSITRRHFFAKGSSLLGTAAMASLCGQRIGHATESARVESARSESAASAAGPHFPGRARNVIYLHMVGGPPQMDLYDYKPVMQEWYDKDLPDSIRMGQRLTTMTSNQARFPI